jgi:outer membrane protein
VQRAGFFNDFQKFDQKMMGAAVSVSQILSTGGRTAAQLSASEADVLSGRERLREVENFILFEVVDSYVSVRRDSRIVAIQERSVGSYERQVQQAQARERGGDLTRVDIAQAQAQLLIIRTSLAQARASLEQSRARFAAVVGRNPGVLEPEPALPGLPTSIDTAYQIAEKESPTLWQAILNERAGRSRVAAARAERNPTIATEGRYGYNAPASYNVRDMGRALSGVVTVTVPLINQGVVGSQIRAAIANQQSLSFLIEDTRRSVDSALLNAWNQSITSQDQVTNGQAAVEANVLAYLGRLQAAAIDQAVAIYDSAANLEKQKRSQLSPFTAIVRAFDSIQVPSSRNRAAPILPPATDTTVIAAVAPPPSGPLATTLPVDPTGRPTPPEGEAPSQRR